MVKVCVFENCRQPAVYGYKQQRPVVCKQHKEDDMVYGSHKYCEHGKRKDICKDCKGSSICQHNRERSKCKECNGGSICQHNRQRSHCHTCSPNSNYFCKHCHYYTANKKYKNYCMTCYVNLFPDDPLSKTAYLKSKELQVKAFLFEEFPDKFKHNKQLIIGNCTFPYRRFIDFHCMIGDTLVAVEVDENQHRGYDKNDEELRINEILHNIGFDKKMVFVRFNPDRFTEKGKQRRVPIEKRLDKLKNTLKDIFEYLVDHEYEDIHTEFKLFYSC